MPVIRFGYKTISLISIIYLNFQLVAVCLSESQQYRENQECYDMLPHEYRKYEVPVNKGYSTKVWLSFGITDLDDIDESNMNFGLHGYYTTMWKDSRLVLNRTVVRNSECAGFIWVPKVRFTAVESKEEFDNRENIININEQKIVRFSQRFGFKVRCKMDFKDYPFDTQFCKFPMTLMDAHFSNVNLEWFTENGTKSIILSEKFKPLQFFLQEPTALNDEDGISVQFVFVRHLMGSVINVFLPSTLIVIVSWVSFWIPVEDLPARVSLGVTSLLTLCTQVQSHGSQLPKLSYIVSLDVWLIVCIFMVFANLIEFAISYSYYAAKRVGSTRSRRQICSVQDRKKGAWIANTEDNTFSQGTSQRYKFRKVRRWLCSPAGRNVTKIDRACRILFPLSFIVFAVNYWAHYLTIYWKEF